jgi:Domain of unknown function (DUF3850)
MSDNIQAVTHTVKSWPEFFEPVAKGEKTFELRKNDRGYKVGDRLFLREYDDLAGTYTGRHVTRLIVYVMDGIGQRAIAPILGLNRGYAILGLQTVPGK